MIRDILKERVVLFVKNFNFKSFFIHVAIIVLSGILATLLENMEAVTSLLSIHFPPEVVWPVIAILGSFLKAASGAIKLMK